MSRPAPSPLGKRLRALRKRHGITLQDLARGLGVHFTTVSAWERGRSEPDYESLGRLAGRLGVGAAELLGEAAGGRPRLRLRVWRGERWGEFRARTEALQVAAATGAPGGGRAGLAELIDLMSSYDIERLEGDPQAPAAAGCPSADDLEARLQHLSPPVRAAALELVAEWLALFDAGAEEPAAPHPAAGRTKGDGSRRRRGLPPARP